MGVAMVYLWYSLLSIFRPRYFTLGNQGINFGENFQMLHSNLKTWTILMNIIKYYCSLMRIFIFV